jgi:hypothetical protein
VNGTANFTGANTFTGNQTVNGNLSATGLVTGSAFNIGSNPFAFGSYANENAFLGFAGNTTTTAQYNTAIGYQALFSIGAGGVDISGDLLNSYNTASGYGALYTNFRGFSNTATGAMALYSNTGGAFNTATGYGALFSNTGGENEDRSFSGSYNTASGYQALYSNTTGYDNTASGYGALLWNTVGTDNTANGTLALWLNTTGNYNTASGGYALIRNVTGSFNTATGDSALYSNTTGDGNTANGNWALEPNTTGSNNTASGYNTLLNNTTGNNLTCIGSGCNVGTDGLTNATAIGANAEVSASNALVLGSINGVNGATSSTNVGIGTTAPDNLLTVNGSADKPGGGSWGTYSDRRLKTVEGNFNSGLSQILKLRPVRYHYNKENGMGIRDTEQHVGLVAQEVQAVIPEAVTENNKGYLLVNNDPILWSMLNAIKEQQTLINQQQAQIARLTRQVETIQATLKTNGQAGSAVRTVKAEGTTVRQ